MKFVPKSDWKALFGLGESDIRQLASKFPIRWPRHYLDLALGSEPIMKMGRPDLAELEASCDDLDDPVSDKSLRPVPFVVQKHRDRAIILCTKTCHFYCRFCFRRAEPSHKIGKPNAGAWLQIYDFFRKNRDLVEPILSGGDPLTLSNQELAEIVRNFNQIPHLRNLRVHTRAPVHFPQRIDDGLLDALKGSLSVKIVTHYNHIDELSRHSAQAIEKFLERSMMVANQAVLLRGVNDSVKAQVDLWAGMASMGVLPHHLHHPDRAPGNATFRLTIAEGQRIFRGLEQQASSPIPDYVLDLPDGSGKIDVMALQSVSRSEYHFRHPDGKISRYKDLTSCPAATIR